MHIIIIITIRISTTNAVSVVFQKKERKKNYKIKSVIKLILKGMTSE
jgi:hypothetical protein